jgi:hypothetical protein
MIAFSRRTILLAAIAALGAVLAAGGYLAWRSACETDQRAFAGEVKRSPDGTFRYFDGRCWTRKPTAPTDTPF